MIYKQLTTDDKNILKKVLQINSAFVVLQHQTTEQLNKTTMKNWNYVKNKMHDASGISNPSEWMWAKDDQINVYYPIYRLSL